eukprot:13857355-Alexandrium_andersonii.AAC.1
MSVWSIARYGLDRSLAWGGEGTDRTRYRFVETLFESSGQAGIRGGSDAVVVANLDKLHAAGAQ